jgi:hypothetical protein
MMKKRIPHRPLPSKTSPKARKARTGDHCPVHGWWVPAIRESGSHFIAEGSIMPSHNGQSVTWSEAAAPSESPEPQHALPVAGAPLDRF